MNEITIKIPISELYSSSIEAYLEEHPVHCESCKQKYAEQLKLEQITAQEYDDYVYDAVIVYFNKQFVCNTCDETIAHVEVVNA